MVRILTYNEIDKQQWQALEDRSLYATWFQTKEAYEFYASNLEEMQPFAVGVEENGLLKGVIVGYTTQEKNSIKQLLTCRSIIIGGPLLDEHISIDALSALLVAVKQVTKGAIYVETRNFNDYSNWKEIFEPCGFQYQPHLNFHVDTTKPWETIENNIGKHRRKYIRLSYRDGVEVELEPTLQQVKEYYTVLQDLYRTKVKMPLQPWSFFERLYHLPSCKYLLVLYNDQVVGGSICMTLKGHGVYEWYACGKDGMFRNIHPSSVTKHIGMKYA